MKNDKSKKENWLNKLKPNENGLKNFNNLENKATSKNLIKEDTIKNYDRIMLTVEKSFLEKFQNHAQKLFIENNRMDIYSYSSFLKILIENVELYFKNKYKKILQPSQNDLKFYTKKGRINILSSNQYPRHNKIETSYLIGNSSYKKLISLMHTYYKNEIKNIEIIETSSSKIPNYSLHFFFYDLVRILEDGEINLIIYDFEAEK